ncbi:class I SAM-dependent methyltransferase [Blastopirellula marina]|uniref:class I SAM-dependent methyltransferase n=1 Tax=Blastopirellula marina TaxID=124 RepID=UPI001304FBA7|nr:class I SAM-dependent methyltransferase [Blastopirellula marina]
MNPKIPITLDSLQQTLLITLCGRAEESRLADSLLHDRFADEAMQRIDFDFSSIRLSHDGLVALAVRAHTLDTWIGEFIASQTSPMVIHLGCGLDSRIFRVNPPSDVPWWEVDFPEVIRLRRTLFPQREGCHYLERSVLAKDWLHEIDTQRNVMVVAEGIFAYFSPSQVNQVLADIVARFPAGEIIFDAYNTFGISYLNSLPSLRRGGVKLRFALDDPSQLEVAVPGLKLVEERTGAPRDQILRASAWMRWGYRFTQRFQRLRRMGQLVRYRFGGSAALPGELGSMLTK